jgi:hypothetical protein
MVTTRQNRRQRRDRIGGQSGASSVAIGFDDATYLDTGQEPSIATIGGGVADSVVASIGGSATDSITTSIGGGRAVDSVVESISGDDTMIS